MVSGCKANSCTRHNFCYAIKVFLLIIDNFSHLLKRFLWRLIILSSFPKITVDIKMDIILPIIGHRHISRSILRGKTGMGCSLSVKTMLV